ncbi:hypothetical protein UFOVP118_28 [uncultured Caudovirales phage]|uniref:Uncharacterized protein n=1 Tax=uncultured Caudovirales phage TaxID=2100421 RepID=A0A6J5L3T3_9CAUD|nr:hypothetical protein UFOVP118_28 [uncultured Caudovirales phage]
MVMTKDEALKMAIEAMEDASSNSTYWEADMSHEEFLRRIQACKEALEQPTQEPEYVYVNPVTKDMYYLTKAEQSAQDFFERGKEIAKWADKQNEQPAQEPAYQVGEIVNPYGSNIKIKQPAQEPVAWMAMGLHTSWLAFQKEAVKDAKEIIPLYTHPAPSWQGLSFDEINQACLDLFDTSAMQGDLDFARAIEQALREKNDVT